MHIVSGESAAGTFKQVFDIPHDEIFVFNDVLSCGPLREFSNIDVWKNYRAKFWSNVEDDNSLEENYFGLRMLYSSFYEEFENLNNASEFNLWIGTGLSDQLLLIFLVNTLDLLGLNLNKLRVFQFEKIQGGWPVQDLGLVSPEQFKNHPDPYILTEEQIAFSKSAWQAMVADDPEKYLRFITTKNECMPLLSKAMAYILLRYPKSINGLSYWDETLLKSTLDHGAKAAKIIAYSLTDCMDGLDWVGDFYLFDRLINMGRLHLNVPLVEVSAFNSPMRYTEVRILPTGLNAFRENLNVIECNGIDDWVGGVHLDSSTGGVWLRKNKTLFYQKL